MNDTCAELIARFGQPMTPTIGTVGATGVANGQPACNSAEPWQTSIRGLGSYTVPKVDVVVSAIFRSQPNAQPGAAVGTNGASRSATYRMTAAQFLAATGRPLAPGLATQDVDLLVPGAVYGDRVNAAHAQTLELRRLLLIGRLDEAERTLAELDPTPLPPAWRAAHELVVAGVAIRRLRTKAARAAFARAERAALNAS